MKRLLLIAYHFPPVQGSTGVTRTLANVKYLAERDWATTVLTVNPRAYEASFEQNLHLIPKGARVVRSFALDARRHLSILGRYPKFLAIPDRWQSWIVGGVMAGLRTVAGERPEVIMSTYPIASAHCIGYALQRITGLPWVAEMRDPMAQADYPEDPTIHRAYEIVESGVFSRARRVVVTTPSCAAMYRERFPAFNASNVVEVPNGFDPDAFDQIDSKEPRRSEFNRRLRILHSGLLYQSERNPFPLFHALARLFATGAVDRQDVEFVFRASGNEAEYQRTLDQLGLSNVVSLLPAIPYTEAIREMARADALLLMQGSNCNAQVPAKLYEYLRCERPIIALTDPAGDTAATMSTLGLKVCAPLESEALIFDELPEWLRRVRNGQVGVPGPRSYEGFSRRTLAHRLARLFDDL